MTLLSLSFVCVCVCFVNYPEVLSKKKDITRHLCEARTDDMGNLVDSSRRTEEFCEDNRTAEDSSTSPRSSRCTHAAGAVCTDKRTDCSTFDLSLTASHGARHERKCIPDHSVSCSLFYSLRILRFLPLLQPVLQRVSSVCSSLRLFV